MAALYQSLNRLGDASDLANLVRLSLLLNNTVGVIMSFIGLKPEFIVSGSVFGISMIFNVLMLSARSRRSSRSRTLALGLAEHGDEVDEEKRCPSVFALSTDTLGMASFLVLYVATTFATVHRLQDGWELVLVFPHMYASIGCLVASTMHAYLAARGLQQYTRWKASHHHRTCPNCHHEIGHREPTGARIALPISPPNAEPSMPRESMAVNESGEGEGDSLIMKIEGGKNALWAGAKQ